jgi:hypothetical protein
MRNPGNAILLGAAFLLLAAASCSSSTSPSGSPVGTYTLSTLNGSALPYVMVRTSSDEVDMTKGRLVVNKDGSCSTSITENVTHNGQSSDQTAEGTGTWSGSGQMTFTWSDGTTDTGSWSSRTISIDSQGLTYQFRR